MLFCTGIQWLYDSKIQWFKEWEEAFGKLKKANNTKVSALANCTDLQRTEIMNKGLCTQTSHKEDLVSTEAS